MILKNLEDGSDIDPDDNEDEDDDPEILQELEKRKEDIMEEFLELAYQKKHEAVEEVKAECKKNKTPKDQEKKRMAEVKLLMDSKRKEGMLDIKKRFNDIVMNESLSL